MGKIFQFFVEVRTELQKVVWPTTRETLRYTVTVIIFSIVVAAILGAVDFALIELFTKLVNR